MISTKQIGDGKTPNKYWVSITNDYIYYNKDSEVFDWISDLKLFDVKSDTLAQFETYEEALNYCGEFYLGEEFKGITVNTITIEDRLSGELCCRQYEFSPENGMLREYSHEDTRFTKEALAKKHLAFA